MQQTAQAFRNGRRSHPWRGALAAALAAGAHLALGGPAAAGEVGNLQPVGTLLLELDAGTSRFRLDDGDTRGGRVATSSPATRMRLTITT